MKILQQVTFNINEVFLTEKRYSVYHVKDSIVNIVKFISDFCESLEQPYLKNAILSLPMVINTINPGKMVMKEYGSGESFLELYYASTTPCVDDIDEAINLIKETIEDFIKRRHDELMAFDQEGILQQGIDYSFALDRHCSLLELPNPKALIKAEFLKCVGNDPIFIGSSTSPQLVTEGKYLRFFPLYSRGDGYKLVSEIIPYDDGKHTHYYAYYIEPLVEACNGTFTLSPVIGVKRYLHTKDTDAALKYSTANENSVMIYTDNKLYSPCISKAKKISPNDWRLGKLLEERYGITIEEINEAIFSQKPHEYPTSEVIYPIFLQYHNKLGRNSKVKSGVPNNDKLDILQEITERMNWGTLIQSLEEVSVKNSLLNKSPGVKIENKSINLSTSIYRGSHTNITLHVIHDGTLTNKEESWNCFEKLIELFEIPNKLFVTKTKEHFRKISPNVYEITFADGNIITLKVVDCTANPILKPKGTEETALDRALIIRNNMELADGLNMVLVQLEHRNDSTDAKKLLREAFDSLGVINQFILPEKPSIDRLKSATKDLFEVLGMGSLNQTLPEDTVVYTITMLYGPLGVYPHKVTPTIGKLDNTSVEIAFPGVTEFSPTTEVYQNLNTLPLKNTTHYTVEDTVAAVQCFLNILSNDPRHKIVIIEVGEELKKAILTKKDKSALSHIKDVSETVVITDILDCECILLNNNSVSYGKGLFKASVSSYISIGDKINQKNSTDTSKLCKRIKASNKIVDEATTAFKDRKGYVIEVLQHNSDKLSQDELAKLIHNLRLLTTAEFMSNRTVLTNCIHRLSDHLQ